MDLTFEENIDIVREAVEYLEDDELEFEEAFGLFIDGMTPLLTSIGISEERSKYLILEFMDKIAEELMKLEDD